MEEVVLSQFWGLINSSLTSILIIILSVLAILDVIDMYGVDVKLFSYSKNKRTKEVKRTIRIIDQYINENKNLFKDNNKDYVNYIIACMGLKNNQREDLLASIKDLKDMNRIIRSKEDMENAILRLLKDPRILIDLTKTESKRKVIYPRLKYYINFTDTINISTVKVRVLSILHYHIETTLAGMGMGIGEIDGIVIPTQSNVVLGVELANLLDIEPIIMHEKKCRVYDDQYWDGRLFPGSKLLVIHDIIYSGDNIVDCIDKLPKTCSVLGVISIANRIDKDKLLSNKIGRGLIEETGVKVYTAIDLDDSLIQEVLTLSETD